MKESKEIIDRLDRLESKQAISDLKALNSMNRKSLDIHSIAEFYAIEKNVY